MSGVITLIKTAHGFTEDTRGGCSVFFWFRIKANHRWMVIVDCGNFAAEPMAYATTDDFGNLVRVPA